ncbi:MAG TPA: hypothetical protein DC017_16060 [Candidatus Wallbacteria bacterium]|nr:hypothetical protein [Candidatus Wallbacteria bacterium]
MAVKKKSGFKTVAIKEKSNSKALSKAAPAKKSSKAPPKSVSRPGVNKLTAGWKTHAQNIIEPGTVIGVNRGLYKHYGIYAGRSIVIHYASAT